MRRRILYIIGLLALLLSLFWLNKRGSVEHHWEPTFNTEDKEPYGAYAFDKLLKNSWTEGYTHTYKSISELISTEQLEGKNLLIITNYFDATPHDIDELLRYVHNGGTAFLAINNANTYLKDSLNFFISFDYYTSLSLKLATEYEKDTLYFCTPEFKDEEWHVPAALSMRYFTNEDLKFSDYQRYAVAKSGHDKAIILRFQIGDGSLLLASNSLPYTNYGALNDSVRPFVWNSLSYLKGKPLVRTEYYHIGSIATESRSPFRYLQSNPSLRWALNLAIVVLIIFMFFTARRKQKAIPVILPPPNKMLDFVRAITGLYIQKNNNADIILKKKTYWADEIKRNYGIDIINEPHDRVFFERLTAKTDTPIEDIIRLFGYLDKINEKSYISDEIMMMLITKMNEMK